MKLSEIQTTFVRLRMFEPTATKGTKIRYRTVQPVIDNIYIIREGAKKGNDRADLYCYFHDVSAGLWIRSVFNLSLLSVEDVSHNIDLVASSGSYLNYLDSLAVQDQYIPQHQIELAKRISPEDGERLAVFRKEHLERREEIRKARHNARMAERQAEVVEANQVAQDIINTAIDTIRTGGSVVNASISIAFMDGNYPTYRDYALFNHLANLYNIPIPLKTKGWVRRCLRTVEFRDGKPTAYHIAGKSDSTVFWKYMKLLTTAIVEREDNTDAAS